MYNYCLIGSLTVDVITITKLTVDVITILRYVYQLSYKLTKNIDLCFLTNCLGSGRIIMLFLKNPPKP